MSPEPLLKLPRRSNYLSFQQFCLERLLTLRLIFSRITIERDPEPPSKIAYER